MLFFRRRRPKPCRDESRTECEQHSDGKPEEEREQRGDNNVSSWRVLIDQGPQIIKHDPGRDRVTFRFALRTHPQEEHWIR